MVSCELDAITLPAFPAVMPLQIPVTANTISPLVPSATGRYFTVLKIFMLMLRS